MKDIMKMYGTSLLKYMLITFVIAFVLTYLMYARLFEILLYFGEQESSLMVMIFSVCALMGMAVVEFAMVYLSLNVLKKLVVKRSAFFMQLPITPMQKILGIFAANVLAELLLYAFMFVSLREIPAEILALVPMGQNIYLIPLASLFIHAMLPIFILFVSRKAFPRINEWLMLIFMQYSLSSMNVVVSNVSIGLVFALNFILTVLLGICAFYVLKKEYNGGSIYA